MAEDEAFRMMWEEFAKECGINQSAIESFSQDNGQLSLQFHNTGEIDIICEAQEPTAITQRPELKKVTPNQFVGALRMWMLYVDDIDLGFELDMDHQPRDLTPQNFARAWRKIEAQECAGKSDDWTKKILSRISKLASFYENWQDPFLNNNEVEVESDEGEGDEEPDPAWISLNEDNVPRSHQGFATWTRIKALYYKNLGEYKAEQDLWVRCQEHHIRAADEQLPEWAEEDEREDANIKDQMWKRSLWWEQVLRRQRASRLESYQDRVGRKEQGQLEAVDPDTPILSIEQPDEVFSKIADKAGEERKTDGGKSLNNKRRKTWDDKDTKAGMQGVSKAKITGLDAESNNSPPPKHEKGLQDRKNPEESKASNTERGETRGSQGEGLSIKRSKVSKLAKRKRAESDGVGDDKSKPFTGHPSKRIRREGPAVKGVAPTSVSPEKTVKQPQGRNKRPREENENGEGDAETVTSKSRKIARVARKTSPRQGASSSTGPIQPGYTAAPNRLAVFGGQNPATQPTQKSKVKTSIECGQLQSDPSSGTLLLGIDQPNRLEAQLPFG